VNHFARRATDKADTNQVRMCQHCSQFRAPLNASLPGTPPVPFASPARETPRRQDEETGSRANSPGMLARLYAVCERRDCEPHERRNFKQT
jgi:hypothetical protein